MHRHRDRTAERGVLPIEVVLFENSDSLTRSQVDDDLCGRSEENSLGDGPRQRDGSRGILSTDDFHVLWANGTGARVTEDLFRLVESEHCRRSNEIGDK